MAISWSPPASYRTRPVCVLGGGVLGRRIACCWASAGYTVHIRDPSPQQRADAIEYVQENVASYAQVTGCTSLGSAEAFEDLPSALANAWLVFEAVPEKLAIKIDTFAELEKLAPADALLCSNSSSYKSGEMLEKVTEATKRRILNTHYMMPPKNRIVELMTDGYTAPEIFPFLVERHKEAGLKPFVAKKESTGFIFNRVWAAIKREFLTILMEDVSTPQQLDEIWVEMFCNNKQGPCGLMDDVGLDTIAFIEEHYIKERGLTSAHLEFLKNTYVSKGKLGRKSTKGGLYDAAEHETAAVQPSLPKVLVLDLGLSQPLGDANTMADVSHRGRILEVSSDGKSVKTLVDNQHMPDGLVVDESAQRLYWTNMGLPSSNDGSVSSSDLNGNNVEVIISPGGIHTPKQLALDTASSKLYVADREGLRIVRSNLDGSALETLIETGDPDNHEHRKDMTRWCVGIALSPQLGKFFWTQKGPSKGGQGRIFSADIETPAGCNPRMRPDITCIAKGLPEPIDLEFDKATSSLFWTDRGEVPFGNTLNKQELDGSGNPKSDTESSRKHEIVAQNFDEAIGLKIDGQGGFYYVADIGGTVWRCSLDGTKEKVYQDKNCAFSGVALKR